MNRRRAPLGVVAVQDMCIECAEIIEEERLSSEGEVFQQLLEQQSNIVEADSELNHEMYGT